MVRSTDSHLNSTGISVPAVCDIVESSGENPETGVPGRACYIIHFIAGLKHIQATVTLPEVCVPETCQSGRTVYHQD